MGMRFLMAVLLAVVAAGCATGEPLRAFPRRNADASLGLVRNLGTTHLNAWVKDEAGRVVEEWYVAPAEDPISPYAVDRSRSATTVVRRLAPGWYTVEYVPFYYVWSVLSGRQRVDLPRGSAGIFVGRDPMARYDFPTGRHWGWSLELHGGDRPRDTMPGNINIGIRCC